PVSVAGTKSQYILHPSIMDSALQEVQYRVYGGNSSQPPLPFALQSVEIFDACTESMWAWVRLSQNATNGNGASDKIKKFDIDLYDTQGDLRVRMQGFSSRVLEGQVLSETQDKGMLLFKQVWKDAPAESRQHREQDLDHRVLLCGFNEVEADALVEQLRVELPGVALIDLAQRSRESGDE